MSTAQSNTRPQPSPSAASQIELPAHLGAGSVTKLYQSLAPMIEATNPVILAGARVARAHGAALQVLAAFISVRAKAGGRTEWRDPSPALCETAARLGLLPALRLI